MSFIVLAMLLLTDVPKFGCGAARAEELSLKNVASASRQPADTTRGVHKGKEGGAVEMLWLASHGTVDIHLANLEKVKGSERQPVLVNIAIKNVIPYNSTSGDSSAERELLYSSLPKLPGAIHFLLQHWRLTEFQYGVCGGKWNSQWSSQPRLTEPVDTHGFATLEHQLENNAECQRSKLSFCGTTTEELDNRPRHPHLSFEKPLCSEAKRYWIGFLGKQPYSPSWDVEGTGWRRGVETGSKAFVHGFGFSEGSVSDEAGKGSQWCAYDELTDDPMGEVMLTKLLGLSFASMESAPGTEGSSFSARVETAESTWFSVVHDLLGPWNGPMIQNPFSSFLVSSRVMPTSTEEKDNDRAASKAHDSLSKSALLEFTLQFSVVLHRDEKVKDLASRWEKSAVQNRLRQLYEENRLAVHVHPQRGAPDALLRAFSFRKTLSPQGMGKVSHSNEAQWNAVAQNFDSCLASHYACFADAILHPRLMYSPSWATIFSPMSYDVMLQVETIGGRVGVGLRGQHEEVKATAKGTTTKSASPEGSREEQLVILTWITFPLTFAHPMLHAVESLEGESIDLTRTDLMHDEGEGNENSESHRNDCHFYWKTEVTLAGSDEAQGLLYLLLSTVVRYDRGGTPRSTDASPSHCKADLRIAAIPLEKGWPGDTRLPESIYIPLRLSSPVFWQQRLSRLSTDEEPTAPSAVATSAFCGSEKERGGMIDHEDAFRFFVVTNLCTPRRIQGAASRLRHRNHEKNSIGFWSRGLLPSALEPSVNSYAVPVLELLTHEAEMTAIAYSLFVFFIFMTLPMGFIRVVFRYYKE